MARIKDSQIMQLIKSMFFVALVHVKILVYLSIQFS